MFSSSANSFDSSGRCWRVKRPFKKFGVRRKKDKLTLICPKTFKYILYFDVFLLKFQFLTVTAILGNC